MKVLSLMKDAFYNDYREIGVKSPQFKKVRNIVKIKKERNWCSKCCTNKLVEM